VHATDLAANQPLRAEIASAVAAGMPTVAECAGLLYLCREVDGVGMVGAVDAVATMTPRLTLGYRTAVSDVDHLLADADTRVTGHEFHRTAVRLGAQATAPAWMVDGHPEGIATPTLHASYLHTHWAGHPHLADRFARAIHDFDAKPPLRTVPAVQLSRSGLDLSFHGDAEVADGLIDLAVNVRLPVPPPWLREVIEVSLERLGAYPWDAAAVEAIARAHAVPRASVLPTAGGAEAFTLLARALRPSRAAIVHPQFTEPEAALRAAGHPVHRVLLSPDQGFRFDPALVPPAADLVVVGNPTNPTSVLHPATTLRRLLRPGRVVCVDEAFMDAVPGELESLLATAVDLAGLLVVRSLTKTWGLAGLRAGYVVGDPDLIGRLRAAQPPWPVSTPALAALEACLSDTARTLAAEAAQETAERRNVLVAELEALGLRVAGIPRGPFVLVNVGAWEVGRAAGWVRQALRERGFALRRGDTFPGLGPNWVRIAVRDEATTIALAKALAELRDEG